MNLKKKFQELLEKLFPKAPKNKPVIREVERKIIPIAYLKPEAIQADVKDTPNNPVPSLPLKSPHVLSQFIEENRDLVYSYLLKMLNKAIKHNWLKVDLFRLGNTPFVAKIERKDYENTLNDLLSFFVSVEKYERANDCKKLIQKHKLNLLLEEETKGT